MNSYEPRSPERANPGKAITFNWTNHTNSVTEHQLARIVETRKFSRPFVTWLHAQGLLGVHQNCIGFPVHRPDGEVTGIHYKIQDSWRYFPEGNAGGPMLIGAFESAIEIWVFESQWDAFAVMDKYRYHENSLECRDVAVLITRGAANTKVVEFLRNYESVRIVLFPQNDKTGNPPPSERWTNGIVKCLSRDVAIASCPAAFKDWDEFIMAGGPDDEIYNAFVRRQARRPEAAAAPQHENAEDIVLPSGGHRITESSGQIFEKMADLGTFFLWNGQVSEVVQDGAGRWLLNMLTPDAFRSRLEGLGKCVRLKNTGGVEIAVPAVPTRDHANVIMAATARNKLPLVRGVLRFPIARLVDGEPQLITEGYDPDSQWFVDANFDCQIPSLEEAIRTLNLLVEGFHFLTVSDRSRALALLITPLLKFSGLIHGPTPIGIIEADQPQSGKTFLAKIGAAVYGGLPVYVPQRKNGVGSYDESIGNALLQDNRFILLDNCRGEIDSANLESLLTATGTFPVRVAYRASINVNPESFVFMMTSNGASLTRDLSKRSVFVAIRKRSHARYADFPEGDVLDHVQANHTLFLSSIIRIVQEWLATGSKRRPTTDHDFRAWAACLDYIVRDILGEAPLLSGHDQRQLRTSAPALNLLRLLAIALEEANMLRKPLKAIELVSYLNPSWPVLAQIDLKDAKAAAQKLGTLFKPVFALKPVQTVDDYFVLRKEANERRADGKGLRKAWFHVFDKKAPEGPQPSNNNS
jgi:hypothetical protein